MSEALVWRWALLGCASLAAVNAGRPARESTPEVMQARAALFEPFVMLGLYLPALVMALRRPNEGTAPAWLEQRISTWPAWLRGGAPTRV